jgi:hypothetical protein
MLRVLPVNPVVCVVGTYPLNGDDRGLIGDLYDKPIVVSLDVEDHYVSREKAGRGVLLTDVM